jgi:hypothetical protein
VSTFLAKAERQIGSKVSNDELTRVTKAFAEQLQETRNVLQAQMDVVRGRAERSTEDFQQVVDKMDAVAMRAEMTPSASGANPRAMRPCGWRDSIARDASSHVYAASSHLGAASHLGTLGHRAALSACGLVCCGQSLRR